MAQLTAFGKQVRKLRIDKGASLMSMAEEIGVTPAFVSSVETGRKSPPTEYVKKVIEFLQLGKKEAVELERIALQSKASVRLEMAPRNREVVAEFARKFDVLETQDMQAILRILNKVPNR